MTVRIDRLRSTILSAELDSCQAVWRSLPAAPFQPKLAAAAPPVWRFRRSFSLDYARMHARRGKVVDVTGQAAAAVMQAAHAIRCERGQRVRNEKRLIAAAGLVRLHPLFAEVPKESASLARCVDLVAEQFGALKDEGLPWQ